MKPRASQGGLVYSTDTGRMCPDCRQPVAACQCQARAEQAQRDAAKPVKLRVLLDTKGRGGKAVTVVRGLPGSSDALAAMAKQLRAACGSGGTLKDGVVEIQGDHVAKVVAWLKAQGLPA